MTLKHMIGLLQPDQGRVRVEGADVTELSERAWVDVRKRFGYVFQGAALFDSLNVAENIAYPLREHLRIPDDAVAKRVAECLDAVGLPGIEGRLPCRALRGDAKTDRSPPGPSLSNRLPSSTTNPRPVSTPPTRGGSVA